MFDKITFIMPTEDKKRKLTMHVKGAGDYSVIGEGKFDLEFSEGENPSDAVKCAVTELENKNIPYICYGVNGVGLYSIISSNMHLDIL